MGVLEGLACRVIHHQPGHVSASAAGYLSTFRVTLVCNEDPARAFHMCATWDARFSPTYAPFVHIFKKSRPLAHLVLVLLHSLRPHAGLLSSGLSLLLS
jgi:hypothetical protein